MTLYEHANDLELSRDALINANINPDSYLATDYLNHFNEIIMMIELVTTMPEMRDEIVEWEPKSYSQHFEDSNFSDKKLAITAYDHAPGVLRELFDSLIHEIDQKIIDLQTSIAGLSTSSPVDPALQENIMAVIIGELRPMIDEASAIINNTDDSIEHEHDSGTAQNAVDALFA